MKKCFGNNWVYNETPCRYYQTKNHSLRTVISKSAAAADKNITKSNDQLPGKRVVLLQTNVIGERLQLHVSFVVDLLRTAIGNQTSQSRNGSGPYETKNISANV